MHRLEHERCPAADRDRRDSQAQDDYQREHVCQGRLRKKPPLPTSERSVHRQASLSGCERSTVASRVMGSFSRIHSVPDNALGPKELGTYAYAAGDQNPSALASNLPISGAEETMAGPPFWK